jgi:hypothetical protein
MKKQEENIGKAWMWSTSMWESPGKILIAGTAIWGRAKLSAHK